MDKAKKHKSKKGLKVVADEAVAETVELPTAQKTDPTDAYRIAQLEAQVAAANARCEEQRQMAAEARSELAHSRQWWRKVEDEIAKLRALVTLGGAREGTDASRGVALLLDPIASNLTHARDQGLGLIQSPRGDNHGAR